MKKSKFDTSEFDIRMGKTIRIIRVRNGYSQADLAKRIGVTFQQIQKYETGANCISAHRLQDIANVFEIPMSSFFHEATNLRMHDVRTYKMLEQMSRMSPSDRDFIFTLVHRIYGMGPME